MEITVLIRHAGETMMRRSTIESLDDHATASQAEVIWIDVEGFDHQIVAELAERFNLDPRAREDITDVELLPKVEELDGHLHVVLHSLSVDAADRVDTIELDCELGGNFLLTFHSRGSQGVTWLRQAVTAHPGLCETADVLLAELLEVTGRRFLPALDEIEAQADALIPRALVADAGVLAEVQAMRRDLSAIRRVSRPAVEVARVLRSGVISNIGPEATRRMGDSYDLFYALSEGFMVARTMLSDTMESYRGAVDQQQAQVSKTFTVYAAMMLPPTLLAGIYGMNFDVMPGTGEPNGFWVLIGLMALFVIVQYAIFARAGVVAGGRLRRAPRVVARGLSSVAKAPARITAVLPPVRGRERP